MTSLLLRSSSARSIRLARIAGLPQCRFNHDGPRPIRPDPPPEVKPARTRFAPSPTGFMHLGSLRTALYNYLWAKKMEGQFILRIEDTDQKRTVKGAEESIMETLRWAGLQWDEGPEVGGGHGPYKQSERTALYRAHAEHLLLDGAAYRCFCPPSRLESLAAARQAAGLPVEYDRRCHNLTPAESDRRAAAGEPYIVRLLAPDSWPHFNDEVYGRITYGTNMRANAEGSYEDMVLLKSDGTPTYHLANVVDDHFMDITHVIRGTEWMPSTPKHKHLYKCFKWPSPKFVHVGLLMGKNNQKLSKRNASVMVSDYRKQGYSPEALINFVALLGWSHGGGGKSDVMMLNQLVERFSIDGLTAGNTIINSEKLRFLQKAHLRRRLDEEKDAEESEVVKVEAEVRALYGDKLETGEPITTDYVRAVLKADLKNYANPITFAEQSNYFFTSPTYIQPSIKGVVNFRKLTGLSTAEIYYGFIGAVKASPWDIDSLKALQLYGKDMDEEVWTTRMRLLRIALAGGRSGPSIADTMHILGKDRVLQRLKDTDKVFEGFQGELEEAEAQYRAAHNKMLRHYQEQPRREMAKELRDSQKDIRKADARHEAMLRAKLGGPPMEKKGFTYMPAAMKKRVRADWEQKVRLQELKMSPNKAKEANWRQENPEERMARVEDEEETPVFFGPKNKRFDNNRRGRIRRL